MSRFALACCCAFAFGLAPAAAQTPPPPAAATAPSPDAVKLVAAMSKVRSFRVQISSPMGMAGTVTFVMLPARRTKAVIAMGSMMNEMVGADGRMYTRMNGGDWHVSDLPAGGGMTDAALKAMTDPSQFHVLPDRVENGTTVGVYEVTPPAPPGMPAGSAMPPLSCTYDKTTYLPRACTFQNLTQTFEGWNDPANVVDVPVVASPAAAASPHP
ncbi:MAG TPA: hypothetical protein VIW69_01595 [Candidatus Elarobacter sp.]